jgi:hypothetical protein
LVLGGLVTLLAIVLIRFNRKRLYIVRKGEAASADQLERIYGLIDDGGQEPSAGWVLARTNTAAPDGRTLIKVPEDIAQFPWTGRVVEIDASRKEAAFAFVAEPLREAQSRGKVFRAVRVPRATSKRGRPRSIFSPRRYMATIPGLPEALRDVCPEYPQELLGYLLCVSGASFEFEPIEQARIGTAAAWVQDPEWQLCDACHRRMILILQVPDGMLSSKGGNCVLYWFGCRRHTESTRMVAQCS